LVGIGGGFALLAKPDDAAMLGCMVAFYLAAAGKFRLRGLSISAAVAVLFLVGAALAIDGRWLALSGGSSTEWLRLAGCAGYTLIASSAGMGSPFAGSRNPFSFTF